MLNKIFAHNARKWFDEEYPQFLLDQGFNHKAAAVMLAAAIRERYVIVIDNMTL